MEKMQMSRRSALRTLALGTSATSVLSVIPLEAAKHVHALLAREKSVPGAGYRPKFFQGRQWETLRKLCETILPPDEKSGGALEANAPEFIDLLTSENQDFQTRLGGGLGWLDSYCSVRHGRDFLRCAPEQQKEVLDRIAFRRNPTPEISQGIEFFALLRNLTTDGFYTSKIGIEDIEFVGNQTLSEFPGCPEVPNS